MRQKLIRFDYNDQCPIVVQPGKEFFNTCPGKWNNDFFKNENPIVLELACGRGEYAIGLAPHFPNKNFIGIDIKGSRIWKGASFAVENQLTNVGFLRTQINNIQNHFTENEVAEIWLTFPDPRPKLSDEKRRLTSERYLKVYKSMLKEGGVFHLKHDNPEFFAYSLEMLQNFGVKNLVYTNDLYNSELLASHFGITTTYEKIFSEKGFTINYLKCEF